MVGGEGKCPDHSLRVETVRDSGMSQEWTKSSRLRKSRGAIAGMDICETPFHKPFNTGQKSTVIPIALQTVILDGGRQRRINKQFESWPREL
jgi:hypothetical protein